MYEIERVFAIHLTYANALENLNISAFWDLRSTNHLVSRAKGNCTTFHRSFTRHLWRSVVLNFIRPMPGWQKLK